LTEGAIAQWNMERPFCDVHHIGLTDVSLCYLSEGAGDEGMGMRKLIASVTVVAAMALAASSQFALGGDNGQSNLALQVACNSLMGV
jgi:hypothetical protein